MQHRVIQPRGGAAGGSTRGRKPGSLNRSKASAEYYNQMTQLYGKAKNHPPPPPPHGMVGLAPMSPVFGPGRYGARGDIEREEGEVMRGDPSAAHRMMTSPVGYPSLYNQMMMSQLYGGASPTVPPVKFSLPQNVPMSIAALVGAANSKTKLPVPGASSQQGSSSKQGKRGASASVTKVRDMIREIDAESERTAPSSSGGAHQRRAQDLSVKPLKVGQLLAQAQRNAVVAEKSLKARAAAYEAASRRMAADSDSDDDDDEDDQFANNDDESIGDTQTNDDSLNTTNDLQTGDNDDSDDDDDEDNDDDDDDDDEDDDEDDDDDDDAEEDDDDMNEDPMSDPGDTDDDSNVSDTQSDDDENLRGW